MAARLILAILALIALGKPVAAQSVVFATSDPTVWIHSNFTGENITVFGNIEPDIAGTVPEGPFDVIITIRGPVSDRVVRRKARQFGIMLNADHALFSNLPSFYRLLSSRPITDIVSSEILAERALLPIDHARRATNQATGNVPLFQGELLRLMNQANLYRTDERGVAFLSPTFFAARVALPANVPNGSFLAQTYVVQNGEIVAERAQRFFVQKTGFERFLGDAARHQPLLYGLASVVLALFTGWLGGVVFRR